MVEEELVRFEYFLDWMVMGSCCKGTAGITGESIRRPNPMDVNTELISNKARKNERSLGVEQREEEDEPIKKNKSI